MDSTIRVEPHCELCGRKVDPYDDDGEYRPYTQCCNEGVCEGTRGGPGERYGVPGRSVEACCFARAMVLFGGLDAAPAGTRRLGVG